MAVVFQVQLGPIQAARRVQGPEVPAPVKYENSAAELEVQVAEAPTLTAVPTVADPLGVVLGVTAEQPTGTGALRATVVCAWGTVKGPSLTQTMASLVPAGVVAGFQVQDGPTQAATRVQGPEVLGPTK
jgi:hypothetical protein